MKRKNISQEFIKTIPLKRFYKDEILSTDILIDFIKQKLKINDIYIQEFINYVPSIIDYNLEVGKKCINALPICFYSGEINNSNSIEVIEFEEYSDFEKSYIAYNKYCEAISRHTFFKYASFAVSKDHKDFMLSNLDNVKGFVEIQKSKYISRNVLVGNIVNPSNVLFSHIDTVENGLIDNLSGVIAMLRLIELDRNLIDKNLFVFAGNEELSYEFPVYWGLGYRKFEEEYLHLLTNCKNIFVIDCVGQTECQIYSNKEIINLAFPINHIDNLLNKIKLVSGDYDKLMAIYHSKYDKSEFLNLKYFKKCINIIYSMLSG